MSIKVVKDECPVKEWADTDAETLVGAIIKVEQDPTGKVYRQPGVEVYTVVRDGKEKIVAMRNV